MEADNALHRAAEVLLDECIVVIAAVHVALVDHFHPADAVARYLLRGVDGRAVRLAGGRMRKPLAMRTTSIPAPLASAVLFVRQEALLTLLHSSLGINTCSAGPLLNTTVNS